MYSRYRRPSFNSFNEDDFAACEIPLTGVPADVSVDAIQEVYDRLNIASCDFVMTPREAYDFLTTYFITNRDYWTTNSRFRNGLRVRINPFFIDLRNLMKTGEICRQHGFRIVQYHLACNQNGVVCIVKIYIADQTQTMVRPLER